MNKTAQERCDEWNLAHGFEVNKAGPRVIHRGFNRQRRRNGDAERWIDEQTQKRLALRNAG